MSSTRRGASSSSRPARSPPRRPTTIPRSSWTGSFDTLVAEVRRHKEKVRKDYVFKRKNRNRADLGAAGPQLQQHKEAGNREDFFRMLRPHLGFLRDYARREIHMLEQDGTLHRGELTVDDLLDQVVILAYERFKDRPRKVSLDLWLTDLLDDALQQWIKQEPRPHVSLEDRARSSCRPSRRGTTTTRGGPS